MTDAEIKSICATRLALWFAYLSRQHATPVLTLGVGHDHVSGAVYLTTTNETSQDEVADLLRGAIAILESGSNVGTVAPV